MKHYISYLMALFYMFARRGSGHRSRAFRRNTRFMTLALAAGAASLLWVGLASQAQDSKAKDGAEQAQKAATVFKEIMSAPDKGIPNSVLDGAECVAVFPNVIKGGFIVGGRWGRGVGSCRSSIDWGSGVRALLRSEAR